MTEINFTNLFLQPQGALHKQYEALRCFFIEQMKVEDISNQYGYTKSSLYSLIHDFKSAVKKESFSMAEHFFKASMLGRKISSDVDHARELIIELRKKQLSVPDIKSKLDAIGKKISERHIYNVIVEEGFIRLPRRDKQEKINVMVLSSKIEALKTEVISEDRVETFSANAGGLMILAPYIAKLGIDKLIIESEYPETQQLSKCNAILSFIALKCSNISRYNADDLWCMDRGLGLFAGLNVLPKTSWYSSYSSRITRKMNIKFLQGLAAIWSKHGLLSDTANMDFTTLPYWGEDAHLENNWSGTRHHALSSVLAALAHDPESGIITYGDSTIRHEDESDTAVEFLDFYKKNSTNDIKYLVFDSKFTTYENLKKLDENKVCFITIRRRGKKIIEDLNNLDSKLWKKTRVAMANGKYRWLNTHEQIVFIKNYGKKLRQIAITGHGKIKPAIIISNDLDISVADIIRKYARRWLVEKTISEQVHFFHLNRLSSSMVIKVDFDLTMTILAHNLYRLLALDLPGFTMCTAQTLYNKFINNSSNMVITKEEIIIKLRKKRNLPAILEAVGNQSMPISWLNDRKIKILGDSVS